jgi:hypothetical protein
MMLNLPRLRAERIIENNASLDNPEYAWKVVMAATGSVKEADKARSSILERMRQRDER